MKIELDWPAAIRVIETTDYKGNAVCVLLIDDIEVLYAGGVTPGGLPPSSWTDIFRSQIGRLLGSLLLDSLNTYEDSPWQAESPTGRETWGPESRTVRLIPEDSE